nr:MULTISPECIES: hypothetical protein [Pseudoalteromonas]
MMGNLFLREKEKWLTWSLWGLVGAALTLYIAMSTKTPYLVAFSAMSILVLLTWWMQRSKRFDFGRAFKVCLYVVMLSVLPAFILVIMPSGDLNRFDLIFQVISFVSLSLLACSLCSLIARRPKQYY